MTTDMGLNAVADRLRRLKAGKELSQDIYGIETPPRESRAEYLTACHAVKAAMVRDERAAVAAFLDAHLADDGEPVTAEWLESVGSREPHDMDPAEPPTMTIPGYRYGVLVQNDNRSWNWCRGSKVLATVRNRGEARRLFAALGSAP